METHSELSDHTRTRLYFRWILSYNIKDVLGSDVFACRSVIGKV